MLAPLPFGCVSSFWAPLFYLIILIISFTEYSKQRKIYPTQHLKNVKTAALFFLGFTIFQIIPLPLFLLKLISPNTIEVVKEFHYLPLTFHSISVVPFETLGFLFRSFTIFFFFYVLINHNMKKREIFSITNTLILSAVLQVIMGLIKFSQGNKYFFVFFHEVKEKGEELFLKGTIANPDHFSLFLEMIFPLAIGMFLAGSFFNFSEGDFRKKIFDLVFEKNLNLFYMVSVVIIGTGIILAGSRAGIVITILVIILLLTGSIYIKLFLQRYMFDNPQIHLKLKNLIIVIMIIAVLLGIQNTLTKFSRTDLAEASRLIYWENSLKVFSNFPLCGSGLGTFKQIYLKYGFGDKKWLTHAHNDYLEYFAEAGIAGSSLFFLVVALILFRMFKGWIKRKHPEIKIIGYAVLLSSLAVIIHSAVDFGMRIPVNSFIFTTILGIGVKLIHYKKKNRYKNER